MTSLWVAVGGGSHLKKAPIASGDHMDVSENSGTPKSSILNRVFH